MNHDTLRAHTAEECRIKFQQHMLMMCQYWAHGEHDGCPTEQDRMEGLCHSISAFLDGRTTNFPSVDLVICGAEGDKEYHISEGENWYEKGMVINDVSLTETLFRVKDKLKS